MTEKFSLIELITLELKGTTGISFQYKLEKVLREYYSVKKLEYTMPSHYGGDKKNDGWVKEKNLYYQIFAPTQIRSSLKKEIISKFKEDLEGLLKILYIDKLWSRKIEEYIFIVNTIDVPLPEDSKNEYEQIVKAFQEKYKIIFSFKIVNLDYIKDILRELDVESLTFIASALRVEAFNFAETCSAKDIYRTICQISYKMSEAFGSENISKNYYKRISSEKKIRINDLNDKKDRIEDIISKLDIVEKAIALMNEDLEGIDNFEKAKKYVIDKYEKLKYIFSGVQLYNKILEESFNFIDNVNSFKIAIEYFVVYIFDRCDIFEKEEKEK